MAEKKPKAMPGIDGVPFEEGQAVVVIGTDGPESITKIAKVRKRLGVVTGYETTDNRKWDRGGRDPSWGYYRDVIAPATATSAEEIKVRRETRRLAQKIKDATIEQWRGMSLDVLKTIVAHLDAVKDPPR